MTARRVLTAVAQRSRRLLVDTSSTIDSRLRLVVAAITDTDPGDHAALERGDLVAALADELESADPSRLWLTLAVLRATLPGGREVERLRRRVRLDGARAALAELMPTLRHMTLGRVAVVTGQVMVDVHHTARYDFSTGIQRVAKETSRRWYRDYQPLLIGWDDDYSRLRLLSDEQLRRFGARRPEEAGAAELTIVPWNSTLVLAELAGEESRARRLATLAHYSGNRFTAITFDCVPLTSAETTAAGMPTAYAIYLTALRYATDICPISQAAGVEFVGWRRMLEGAGLAGPAIHPVLLPTESEETTEQAMARVARRYKASSLPMVLVVGSHEPRKNHLAILHAAELLWRDGYRFTMLFVGANSWSNARFSQMMGELKGLGRPFESVLVMDEADLWAAYRLADFVVFPSLNEGYGLPVAEALSVGTPVVTSDYGSLAEIADDGGAVLVDPRSDDSLRAGIEIMLSQGERYAQLCAEAESYPRRSWDSYAEHTWALLAGDKQ